MKKRIHILLPMLIIFCLSSEPILSQRTKQMKKNKYDTWVLLKDNTSRPKGYLSEVGDNQIVISDILTSKKQSINLNNVDAIHFWNKERLVTGIVVGTLTGIVVGAIHGDSKGDDWLLSARQKAIGHGFLYSVPGAIIGGLFGSLKVKIPITGTGKNQREELLKYKLSY